MLRIENIYNCIHSSITIYGRKWAVDEKKIVFQKAKETIKHMYMMGRDIKTDKLAE